MPKINPYNLPRPERPITVREFGKDGQPFTLALRAADASDKMLARERADVLTRLYVTGDGDREAAPLPDPDIKPSRYLISAACLLREMQAPEDPREIYDEMDVIQLAVKRPRDWMDIEDLVGRVQLEWEKTSPNSPGAPTD